MDEKSLISRKYKAGNFLIFTCTFLYAALMTAKGIFTAEIAELIIVFGTDKPTASLASTYYFLTYASVQIIMTLFMGKMDMKKYLSITIPLSAVCTAIMGLATKIEHMWIVFSINGVFQAGMWGGIVYTITRYLPPSMLAKGNTIVNAGYALGNVLAYALSALFVSFNLWRLPFFIAGALSLLAIILYIISVNNSVKYQDVPDVRNSQPTTEKKKRIGRPKDKDADQPMIILDGKKKRVVFYIIDMFMSFLLTAPYYMIMNWLPNSLIENHGFSNDVAIYISIIAPIVTLIGPTLTISSCDKVKNFVKPALFYSLMMLPMPLLLALLYKVHFLIVIVLSVACLALTNGIKAITLSVVSIKLRTQINSGMIGTLNNATASVAAAVVPTIIGAIIESAGWQASYFVTFGASLAICLALVIILALVKIDNSKNNTGRESKCLKTY